MAESESKPSLLRRLLSDINEWLRMPRAEIYLMLGRTQGNDPFFEKSTRDFYNLANARHPKFPLFKSMSHGLALCKLSRSFDEYFMAVDGAARRNYKKAKRSGYEFRRINYNDHLDEIRAIWQSAKVRQGEMPEHMLAGKVEPILDPVSKNHFHDYPYFGIFHEGRLVAYAGCLVAGTLCNLNDIYGHADHQRDGVVPMLAIDIAGEMIREYKTVVYYSYGTYFGASETMRRFKKKLSLTPHLVRWHLDEPRKRYSVLIFRYDAPGPAKKSEPGPSPGMNFFFTHGRLGTGVVIDLFRQLKGIDSLKAIVKVMRGRRILFGIREGNKLRQYAWANIGFCRHYQVEPDAVVLGNFWTSPEFRGKGFASFALKTMIEELSRQGYRRFYIDTTSENLPAQKMIDHSNFVLVSEEVKVL